MMRMCLNTMRRARAAASTWLRRRFDSSGLAGRIGIRALSLLSIVLVTGGAASFAVTALLIKEQVEASLRHDAQLAAQRVELEIGNVYSHVLAMAQNPLVSNSLTDTSSGRQEYLAPFLQSDVLARRGATLALLDYAGAPVGLAQHAAADVEVPPSKITQIMEGGVASAELIRRDGQGAYQLQILIPVVYPASARAEGVLLMQADLEQLVTLSPRDETRPMPYHLQLVDAGGVLIGDGSRSSLLKVHYPVHLGGPFSNSELALEAGIAAGSLLRPLSLWLAGYSLVGIAVLVPILFVVRRMARTLTAPLEKLTSRVDGIRDSGRLDFTWHYPVEDEIGRLGRSFASMVDRLAQIQEELEQRVEERTRELSESRNQLRYMLDFAQSTLDGLTAHICVLDADGFILSVNKSWREFGSANGAAPEAIGTGVNYLEICSQAQGAPGAAAVAEGVRAVLRGESHLFETEYACHAPAQPRWYRLRVSRLRGGIGGVVIAHENITATKIAEAALQDRNDQLDTMLSSSPTGLLSIDHHGMVRFVNAAFSRMTGIAPEAILDQPEERLDACLRGIIEEPAEYPGLAAFCSASQQVPGNPALHLLTLSLPRHGVLAITGVTSKAHTARKLFYFRDVTHEMEIDRMKSDFLATAAHELRTPMASIYGFTELLLADEFEAEVRRDLLGTIHEQTERLVKIINELLDLARIEARRGKDFRYGRVLPAALVERALAALAADPARWPVDVLHPEQSVEVWGDPDKLCQALLNVVSNAVKYSPHGGPIRVRIENGTGKHSGQVGVAVRDAGIGMSKAHTERIFERFFRADASGKIPGTGLGMAIVKEIIDLHHGSITVESELGKGTEIVLWLPAAPVPVADKPAQAPPSSTLAGAEAR